MTHAHEAILAAAMVAFLLPGCRHQSADRGGAADAPTTLDMEQARQIALAEVPGTIIEGELEDEDGQRIYSFDITPQGKPDEIREVHVDPSSGKILRTEIETPEDEAREDAEDEGDEEEGEDDD